MLHRVGALLPFFGLILLLGSACDVTDQDVSQSSLADADSLLALPESLYFWQHAAPIIFENCTPCHHNGGAGPFPLTNFDDVKKRTKTIRYAIADGFMPPWPADPAYRHFKNEKVLSEREKAIILQWIGQGAVEGLVPAEKPTPKTAVLPDLGEPDMVIHFRDTVRVAGDNVDRFRMAKVVFELQRDTIVKAINFVPGNRQLVHHVNGNLLNYADGKKAELNDGQWILDAERVEALDAYKMMDLAQDDGTYPPLLASAFNYLPGVEASAYPKGLGSVFFKKKGAFLLNTLHYGPSPVDTFDMSTIELYFAEKRPERPLQEIQMGTLGETQVEPEFVVTAGEISAFRTVYKVKQDISILTINPHMHLLGQEFTAYAISESRQDTIPLIHIPQWDFRWQYFYTFENLLKVPANYEIIAEATFDNTSNNPLNPFYPPKTLRETGENMKTTDEMFQFFITYVPYRTGDENIKL